MDKEDVVHIYKRILLSHKKLNNAICSNMDGPRDYHTKLSKAEKDTSYDIIRGIKKKMIQVNLFIKQKQTHSFQKQSCGNQRGNMKRRHKLGGWD